MVKNGIKKVNLEKLNFTFGNSVVRSIRNRIKFA